MKKLISTVVIAMLFGMVQLAFAVPAAPIIHKLEQPDGTKFQARMWGDEWQNGWETLDGYTIVHDKATRNWVYAVRGVGGNISASNLVVARDSPKGAYAISGTGAPMAPPGGLVKHIRPSSKVETAPPDKGYPLSGNVNVPVILINFPDRNTTYNTADFDNLLFNSTPGNRSMREYYNETSYGTFIPTSGPGGVVGWYTASNNHDYYGYNNSFVVAADLAREAVVAADVAGFNFSQYDNDGDGYVDGVVIIHQGTGREVSSDDTDIWSHRWNLVASTNGAYTADGVTINDYAMQPEIYYGDGGMMTMGVFAHEYGHLLGLPNLYDTDYTSEGIGKWGIMGGGTWNKISRDGDSPAHFTAWSKWFLGWVTPTQVSTSLINESIDRVEFNDDVYQILSNAEGPADWNSSGDGTGEYFLVENRHRTGFDLALPEEGLLIWHVDESKRNNTNESHYLVALEQADGLFHLENNNNTGDSGDPWASTATGFTEATTPNTALYNGSLTGVRVTDISASATTMTANLIVNWPPPTMTFTAPTPQNNSNLSQNYVFVNVTASESLSTALLEWNGTNVTMSSGSWYSNQTELADGTYTYLVWGNDLGGNWNVTETRVVNIDTTAPTITIHSPENKTTNDTIPLLNVTFDEPVNTAWYNNGTTDSAHYYSVSNLTLNLTTLEEGPHNVTVYANDSFGNLNYSTVYFTFDTTPPNVTITNPVDGEIIKVFDNTVGGTAFDIVSTIYKVNITGNGTGPIEVDVANGEFSYDISYVNGSNTIVVNATDAAGYTGSANVTVTVIKELQWDVNTTDESGMFMWDVNAGDMDLWINLSTGNQSVNGTMNITAHALAADAGSSVMDANTGSWETHLGKFFEINVSDNLGETNLTWVEIRVDYLQEEVDAAKLAEDSLALYWDNGGTWERLTNQSWVYSTGINTTNADGYSGYVWANLSHFSTYSVAGQYRADLTVSNVTFSYPNPMDRDVVVINVTVNNTNATDADNFTVELLVDGTSQANNTLSVKSNSTNNTQFNWTSINGTHSITIVADAGSTITEVDETNNNATAQITVKTKPDLSVSNIIFSESSPTDGDAITINATISNGGETGAVGFNVSFLVDGIRQANNTLLVVAGSTNTTQFTWTSVQGTHNITIVADADNAINESNETNNNATAQITVQAKQSPPSSGGGGGGSSSKALTEYIKSIAPGETGSVTFDPSKSPYITEIAITARAKLSYVRISLEMLNKKPNPSFSDPSGLVLSYLKITKSNILSGRIEKVDIRFRVEKGWLKENDIDQDSVTLSREVKKGWEELPTAQFDEDQDYVYYSAETPGFSFFVVTAYKGSGYVKEKPAKIERVVETASPLSKAKEVTPLKEVEVETPPPTPPKDRRWMFIIAGILALLTMVIGLYLKNKLKT